MILDTSPQGDDDGLGAPGQMYVVIVILALVFVGMLIMDRGREL